MKKYLFIWLIISLCCIPVSAENGKRKGELLQQLSESKQNENRLDVIYELIKITYQDPDEQRIYIGQLLDEAQKQKSNSYKCQAYMQYMIQAYNKYDREEINRWMKLLEPLARKEKLYDLLFRGKQCVIDMMLFQEQYELEEKEARLMLKEAQELKNILGQILAYHSLTHVYLRTYREKEALEMIEKAVKLGPKCSNQFIYNEVVRTANIVCERINEMPKWLKYLQLQDSLLNQLEQKLPNESFAGDHMLNNISYLQYYIKYKDRAKANKYLQLIDQNYSEQYSTVFQYNYWAAKNTYYVNIKDWDKALEAVDHILVMIESSSKVEYAYRLTLKAYLLSKQGKVQEAIEIYKQVKLLKDSLEAQTLSKQAEQLKNSYQTDIQILDQETLRQRIQLIFLILSGIIVLILIASAIHACKVKHRLTLAEHEMREMTEQTEEANKIKERFLSNINMTIRPPLDIIVNSSSSLAMDEGISKADKKQLSSLITQTSDQLMELINDILLLSKLEAGMMKFTLKEINLILCIQRTVEAANLTGPAKVSLNISQETPSYKIHGDESYLKQVLNSLCHKSIHDNEVISIQIEKNEKSELIITFTNTILASNEQPQDFIIRNEINRMLIESLGGTYNKDKRENTPALILVFKTRETNHASNI